MDQQTTTKVDLRVDVEAYILTLEERLRGGQNAISVMDLCSEITDLVFEARARYEDLPPGIEALRKNWVSLSKSANANDHHGFSKSTSEVVKFLKVALVGKHSVDGVEDISVAHYGDND